MQSLNNKRNEVTSDFNSLGLMRQFRFIIISFRTAFFIVFFHFIILSIFIDDPWSLESALYPSTTPKTSNDPWQPTTNPGLSMNISDPWGLSSTTTATQPVNTTTIDNELSDFFGASASMLRSFVYYLHT